MFSVVTITHGDPAGLKGTFESLRPLAGSEISWEHLVVDGTPDVSAPVLADLPKGWPLRHLPQEPRGIYPAMNLGIAESRGRFLWFLNSGDELHSLPALQVMLSLLEDRPGLQIACGAAVLVSRGEAIVPFYPDSDFHTALISSRGICHQSMIYRREVFNSVGVFNPRYTQTGDVEHHWRCLEADTETVCGDWLIARYDTDGASATSSVYLRQRIKIALQTGLPSLSFWEKISHVSHLAVFLSRHEIFRLLRRTRAYAYLRPAWLRYSRWIARRNPESASGCSVGTVPQPQE